MLSGEAENLGVEVAGVVSRSWNFMGSEISVPEGVFPH
jgi:hypothetical protein